jgi:hypothetical protein
MICLGISDPVHHAHNLVSDGWALFSLKVKGIARHLHQLLLLLKQYAGNFFLCNAIVLHQRLDGKFAADVLLLLSELINYQISCLHR